MEDGSRNTNSRFSLELRHGENAHYWLDTQCAPGVLHFSTFHSTVKSLTCVSFSFVFSNAYVVSYNCKIWSWKPISSFSDTESFLQPAKMYKHDIRTGCEAQCCSSLLQVNVVVLLKASIAVFAWI